MPVVIGRETHTGYNSQYTLAVAKAMYSFKLDTYFFQVSNYGIPRQAYHIKQIYKQQSILLLELTSRSVIPLSLKTLNWIKSIILSEKCVRVCVCACVRVCKTVHRF